MTQDSRIAEEILRQRARDAARASPQSTYARVLRELRNNRYVNQAVDAQFSDAWLVLGVLLTALGLATNQAVLLTPALLLFVIAAVGWGWNRLSLFGLYYTRQLSETRAFLGETVDLTLEVRNRKFLPVAWLVIGDIFPADLPLAEEAVRLNRATNLGEFATFWSLGAFGRLARHYKVQCNQRGFHFFGPAKVETGDGLGMFTRQGRLALRQRLIVYPRLYTVAELGLPAKNPFGERGSHEQLFEDPLRTAGIRDWQPADGLKRVHWRATARHGAMLSRHYEPSEEQQVLIFLNVATMPRHWQGQIPELLERAISVAGSLAAMCAEQRLAVGLIANGFLPESDQPLRLLPGRSPDQLVCIMELLAAVRAFATFPIEELILHEAPRLPWGATLVVVTAIAHDGLLAALLELRHAGRKVVLFTLAEKPPEQALPGITVYHLPHLVEDLIMPTQVSAASAQMETARARSDT